MMSICNFSRASLALLLCFAFSKSNARAENLDGVIEKHVANLALIETFSCQFEIYNIVKSGEILEKGRFFQGNNAIAIIQKSNDGQMKTVYDSGKMTALNPNSKAASRRFSATIKPHSEGSFYQDDIWTLMLRNIYPTGEKVQPVAAFLEKHRKDITSTKEFKLGSEKYYQVLLAHDVVVKNQKVAIKSELLFDLGHGCLLKRFRQDVDGGYHSREIQAFTAEAPDTPFIPLEMKATIDDISRKYEGLWLKCWDLAVNKPIDSSVFALQFPPETNVFDMITGLKYDILADGSRSKIESSIATPSLPLTEKGMTDTATPYRSPTPIIYYFVASAILFTVLGIVVYIRQRIRKGSV